LRPGRAILGIDAEQPMTKLVDNAEVERFGALAREWWDPRGKFRPLHQINPVRLGFLRGELLAHTARDGRAMRPFAGLSLLDIGCGGGLIAEPLARLGASVTGIDPSAENIETARRHAHGQALDIDYLTGTSGELATEGRRFDCVIALEVIEHVPDVRAFLQSCSDVTEPGGLIVLSTLNRTLKSFALGIVGAEYVLGWLPRGTHQWRRFVAPDELRQSLMEGGLTPVAQRGMSYDPIRGTWRLSADCSVNYLMAATKPKV
jgi:2-polyprenyl-6-hydroxyphenyl methylase / 3-demethylubiquinone-9 3-methyltransferase